MKRLYSSLFVLAFLFFLCLGMEAFPSKTSTKDLLERYRKWLEEEVVYIITPKEKEAFLQLEKDRERDFFIEAFWKQRDPTPGTPENEYKFEHYRRISYANRMFGWGEPKAGWMTDRGKIYIILGSPHGLAKILGD